MTGTPSGAPEPRGFLERLLRWFFHHLYTSWAWSYDAVAWLVSLGAWSGWRRTGLDRIPVGSPILEIGCGTGRLLAESLLRGDRAIGIDASGKMTRLTGRGLARAGLPVVVARAQAQALPFLPASFPIVLSTFPSEYLLDPATLREVRRVLRPEGSLLVVLSARIVPRFVWERLARWLFDATGQSPRPTARWLSPFENAGFSADFETVETPGASVLHLVADTPASDLTSSPTGGARQQVRLLQSHGDERSRPHTRR